MKLTRGFCEVWDRFLRSLRGIFVKCRMDFLKFTTDFCEVEDEFLRSLGQIILKFVSDFCEVEDGFL